MTVHRDTSPYWREFDAAAPSLLGLAVLAAAALAATMTLAGLPPAHAQRDTSMHCEPCTPVPSAEALPSTPGPHSTVFPR